jgi:hypothetical protein
MWSKVEKKGDTDVRLAVEEAMSRAKASGRLA